MTAVVVLTVLAGLLLMAFSMQRYRTSAERRRGVQAGGGYGVGRSGARRAHGPGMMAAGAFIATGGDGGGFDGGGGGGGDGGGGGC
jgi:hypothetical protein